MNAHSEVKTEHTGFTAERFAYAFPYGKLAF